MAEAHLNAAFSNYFLTGVQTQFVDNYGKPIKLGNSLVEFNQGVAPGKSSCITCHQYASFDGRQPPQGSPEHNSECRRAAGPASGTPAIKTIGMLFTPYVSGAIIDSMPRNVNEVMRMLNSEQRKKVQARAAELIAEEMTLQQLRRTRKLTQVSVAKALGITQDSVSRLEKRSDVLLSSLRKAVQVMGGNLSLVAEFPDRAPVVLTGIGDVESDAKPNRRKHARA